MTRVDLESALISQIKLLYLLLLLLMMLTAHHLVIHHILLLIVVREVGSFVARVLRIQRVVIFALLSRIPHQILIDQLLALLLYFQLVGHDLLFCFQEECLFGHLLLFAVYFAPNATLLTHVQIHSDSS